MDRIKQLLLTPSRSDPVPHTPTRGVILGGTQFEQSGTQGQELTGANLTLIIAVIAIKFRNSDTFFS